MSFHRRAFAVAAAVVIVAAASASASADVVSRPQPPRQPPTLAFALGSAGIAAAKPRMRKRPREQQPRRLPRRSSYLTASPIDDDDDDGATIVEETDAATTIAMDSSSSPRESRRLLQQKDNDFLQSRFDFPLDPWQLAAGRALLSRRNVVVTAPTGAGKTVVGEMALRIAFDAGQRAIYTTPLKALSNQKFTEMRALFGAENVGLLTGDVSVNRGARITVMTTEVYRNMAWRARRWEEGGADEDNYEDGNGGGGDVATLREKLRHASAAGDTAFATSDTAARRSSNDDYGDLSSNSVVVLDEFHYMGQKGRGSTWEECVVVNPPHTQIVGLSATLPNADRLSAWMEGVTGRGTTWVEAGGTRPVPLRYKFATKGEFCSLFVDPDAGPGAPRGLWGLRGDGIAAGSNKKKNKKKKGKTFKSIDGNTTPTPMGDLDKLEFRLPEGLGMNPILRVAQEKRAANVERRVKRIASKEDDDDDSYGRDRGRQKRGRDRYDDNRGGGGGMSARDQKKLRETMLKTEMRKDVPSLPTVLRRLRDENLLPAIFFIFSRKGCDNAAIALCEGMKRKAVEREEKKMGVRDSQAESWGWGEDKGKKKKSKGRGRGEREDPKAEFDEESGTMRDSKGRAFRADLFERIMADDFDSIFDDIDDLGERPPLSSAETAFLSESHIQRCADAGLLDVDQTREVAIRVQRFNAENPEIAFDAPSSERFLLGVGSHHAGMLPAHKAFSESLFRAERMRAIFATETLAAGLNMPARTTVVCAMAKRGDLGMDLLETSNMLQMAGRAGRRGLDEEGTCVLTATPFEGPDEAISILTDEIKPIVSQFGPSYGLAVNLILRGDGELDVARSIMKRSFAVWESRERERDLEELAIAAAAEAEDAEESGEEGSTGGGIAGAAAFLDALQLAMETEISQQSKATTKLSALADVLSDGKRLNKASKKYAGAERILDLERSTLEALDRELRDLKGPKDNDDDLDADDDDGVEKSSTSESEDIFSVMLDMVEDDRADILSEIMTQRKRVAKGEREVSGSVVVALTKVANRLMKDTSEDSKLLRGALAAARGTSSDEGDESSKFEAGELNGYVTKAPKRIRRELLSSLAGVGGGAEEEDDECWNQMLALTRVLKTFGCLKSESDAPSSEDGDDDDPSAQTYRVTPGGGHVGSLGVDNALWQVAALGGAWDVEYASTEIDEFQDVLNSFDGFNDGLFDEDGASVSSTAEDEIVDPVPKPQREAETLTQYLCDLSSSEMAGYVSAFVVDPPRNPVPIIATFRKLTNAQQRVVQSALLSLDRLQEVQRKYNLDDALGKCQLELTACDVVTAWASDCTWNEALEMSGAAPGDLVRTLSRALDTLRQLANLPYAPARGGDGNTVREESLGVHPTIRALCRDAAFAMDRYPVKDILPFEEEDEDEDDDENEDEEEEASKYDEEEEGPILEDDDDSQSDFVNATI